MLSSRLKSFMNAPKLTKAVLLFIVHLAWESIQTPFFSGMPGLQDGLLSTSCVKAIACYAINSKKALSLSG